MRIQALKTSVIPAYSIFREKYPELESVFKRNENFFEDWDFLLFSALIALLCMREPNRKEEILEEAISLDPKVTDGIENFYSFLRDGDPYQDAGVWMIWNLGLQQPSYEEVNRVAPAIGNFLKNLILEFQQGEI